MLVGMISLRIKTSFCGTFDAAPLPRNVHITTKIKRGNVKIYSDGF
jgi:hypothetical protein